MAWIARVTVLARGPARIARAVFLWARVAIGMLGAVGGLLAFLFGLVFAGLELWNHGGGNAWGGGRFAHGRYYLFAAGHYTAVSAVMFWSVWLTQIVMFFGAGLMLLMLGVEGLVWIFGGESFVWGRRGKGET